LIALAGTSRNREEEVEWQQEASVGYNEAVSFRFDRPLALCWWCDAQGNKEQFLENQYNTGIAHSQAMDRSPTRPPSVKARLETTIPTAMPTPKPPTKAMNKPSTQAAAATSNLPTPRPSRAQPTKKPPTKPPSRLPTAASLTVSPTPASPSETPSTSPAPSTLPTLSASPTQEPTVSASQSPSNSPSVSPSVAPTSQPSAGPSSNPTHQPSSQPSLSQSPSAAPTNSAMPSALPSSSPTIPPSDSPSVAPSSTPSEEPSSIPSAAPSLQPSSQPSLSAVPSTSPTNSAMPSARPSVVPSSAPSSQPSEKPSAEPSLSPSGVPSASPSSIPSQVPSDLPTAQPSVVPTLSVQPSAAPSQSMVPTEDGFEEIEAEIAVPVRSSSLMDKPTVAVFETTTMNFLNDYLPSNDSITVTSVKATDQTLETRRKLAERDLQVADLKVDILVKATWFVGNATDAYPLEENVEKTFQKHYDTYASMLVDASSFFRIGFQAGRSDGEAESPKSDGSPLTGSTLIIVCAVAGCALFALFSAFFVWRLHASRGNTSSGPSMGLPSWSSQEISASSGFVSNGSMESPTESEIYTRQHSRRSIFSERSSPSSSQRSGLSERSDSPTVGSPYNIDDKSIDVSRFLLHLYCILLVVPLTHACPFSCRLIFLIPIATFRTQIRTAHFPHWLQSMRTHK
jgi:hypothetical protein